MFLNELGLLLLRHVSQLDVFKQELVLLSLDRAQTLLKLVASDIARLESSDLRLERELSLNKLHELLK